MKLAQNHAKLCLRKTVFIDDALIAIWLTEENLAFKLKTSLFNFKSLPQDQSNLYFLYQQEGTRHQEMDEEDGSSIDDLFLSFYECVKQVLFV